VVEQILGEADKVQISVVEPDSKLISFKPLQQDINKFPLHYL
jgi:hypothetical protein